MSLSFLKDIVNYKKEFLIKKGPYFEQIIGRMQGIEHTRYSIFKQKISAPNRINLIAEIKKASPSKGLIREDFDAIQIAQTYIAHGADALSILTEDKYFLGSHLYVKKVSSQCQVPILAKDFFLQEGQIYEAKLNGASAILLIVAILEKERLQHLLRLAHQLDLDCLVEVHTKDELDCALDIGAEIIGINNRDLNTFKVSLEVCEELIPYIPQGKVIVVESGISKHEEILRLRDLGVNAVLIGETFMKAKDIGSKVTEMMGHRSKTDKVKDQK